MRGLLTLLFAATISLPLLGTALGLDGADPLAEKRDLAALPAMPSDWKSARAFPAAGTAWFDDHFAFRASLVRLSAELRYFALGVSPNPSVIKGRGGWLFYGSDGGSDDYTREKPFTAAELAEWRESIVRTNRWLRERGIAYVFAVAPDKHVIYPEEMPASIRPRSAPSRLEQLFEALEGSGVITVDFRPALLEAKKKERVYDLTDTHWNRRGAFVAYREIVAAIRTQASAVDPALGPDDFVPTTQDVEGQDLAVMAGLARSIREEQLDLSPKHPRRARVVEPARAGAEAQVGRLVSEIPGSAKPRAVFFHDSFLVRARPFLSEHFGRAVYAWQTNFDSEEVVRERATVVVHEVVGRYLTRRPYSDVAQ